MTTHQDPAARLMDKIRNFSVGLDDDERALFAALIAPGVAKALAPEEDEVEGYGLTSWMPSSLPDQLTEQIKRSNINVTGL
jgi:hypothetical protein